MIPAMISTIPTIWRKVDACSGTKRVASGLRYMDQSARTLKYLSRPARIGATPRPIRRAHQARFKRLSKFMETLPKNDGDSARATNGSAVSQMEEREAVKWLQ